MEIRPIFEHELESAFPLVAELRTHLDLEEFLVSVRRQAEVGYEMWGMFDGRALVAAIGFRPVRTLARGPHLHVDDLVVTAPLRKRGLGSKLLAAVESEALRRGLESVFLDSRPEVLGFYAELGYAPHTATLVRKDLRVTRT